MYWIDDLRHRKSVGASMATDESFNTGMYGCMYVCLYVYVYVCMYVLFFFFS